MHYTNAQEFIDDCMMGLDIEFAYGADKYTVLGCYENGPLIGRQHPKDDIEQQFPTPDALLDKFIIDGKPLRELITKVDLLLH